MIIEVISAKAVPAPTVGMNLTLRWALDADICGRNTRNRGAKPVQLGAQASNRSVPPHRSSIVPHGPWTGLPMGCFRPACGMRLAQNRRGAEIGNVEQTIG